jgi:hypothetical protein
MNAHEQTELLCTELRERGYKHRLLLMPRFCIEVKAMSLLDALHISGTAMEYDSYTATIARDATDCAYHVYIEVTCNDPTKGIKP